ncbi:MAG: hypothetical protein H0U44_03980 [Flavisolibacter sp.]|jgi:hypothetical protein|nr:hypothetical protein [Flavisolibacter sp.]
MIYNNYSHNSDRYNIGSNETHKLQQLSQSLDYPIEDILRAIQEVGYNEEEIEEYIRDRYNRT